MIKNSVYQSAKFLKSACEINQLPTDKGAEVAFIGCSNSGKSSALNTITGLKGLARVSKTPGCTQAINVFSLSNKYRLIDLPGYGYAKVPRVVKERWAHYIDDYLRGRQCLAGLVLIMDIRHPLKTLDQHLIEWTVSCHIPIHVLLTKSDKLSRGQQSKALNEVRQALSIYGGFISVQLFSSHDRVGVCEVQDKLNAWLDKEV